MLLLQHNQNRKGCFGGMDLFLLVSGSDVFWISLEKLHPSVSAIRFEVVNFKRGFGLMFRGWQAVLVTYFLLLSGVNGECMSIAL